MIEDWREMDNAPQAEAILVCLKDCSIVVGIRTEMPCINEKGKESKKWTWVPHKYQVSYFGLGHSYNTIEPMMWQPLPFPPKYLYERKLTADLLEKQLAELRR